MELAAYCDPPLTTVRIPATEMGLLSARVLLESINDKGMAITWAIKSLTEPTEYAEKNQKTL